MPALIPPALTPPALAPPALAPLEAVHLAVAAEIHRRCFAEAWDEAALSDLLAMPGAYGFLAGGDAPSGLVLARVAADEAEILTIAVLPGSRGGGLGGRLLEQALDTARARGATRMFLEVEHDNVPALSLYRRHGFEVAGRRAHYYGQNRHAVVLSRLLDEA